MTFKKQLTTAIATGAVLLNALAPMAFASDVTVTGNGAFSDSTVNTTQTATTVVGQTNTANVSNNVTSNASTGGNTSNFNTGGDTAIHTGDATNNVEVSNALNLNQATADCGCVTGGNTNVTVSDNGAFSTNRANVTNTTVNTLAQNNTANVSNNVNANSNTGGNTASFGGGNTTISTGNASSTVGVSTAANANVANFGGSSAVAGNGNSVEILGNLAYSDNRVNLTDTSVTVLGQSNVANVANNVNSNANSGHNSADFNSGDTSIVTGDASSDVTVQNLLNFNSADLDCGCVLGGSGLLKIGHNGAFSTNRINATDLSTLLLTEANVANLANNVNGNVDTGANAAGFSTGWDGSDPSIVTGNADSTTSVSNAGNVNLYGQDVSLSLGNLDLGVNFDLAGMWAMLHSFLV